MRLIDADKLTKVFEERLRVEQGGDGTKERYAYMAWLRSYHAVKNAPTIDAVEVVRCKDCKFFHYADYGTYGECIKDRNFEKTLFEANDFCSYGERKE